MGHELRVFATLVYALHGSVLYTSLGQSAETVKLHATYPQKPDTT